MSATVNYPEVRERRPWIIPIKISAAVAWTVPASLTELSGVTAYRCRANLRQAKEARLHAAVTVVAGTGAKLRVQYSLDNGSNWYYLDGAGTGLQVAADAVATAVSSWITIASRDNAAWESALLRVVGILGDGATAGSFGNIMLEVR